MTDTPQHCPELFTAYGIDTCSRFVQEQDFRSVDQCAAKCQFLFHAAGERTCPSLPERLQLTIYILDIVIVGLDIRAENRSIELKVFLDAEVLIESEMPRHISDFRTYLLIVFHHVQTADARRSAVGKGQCRKNTENRRLACTVRSDESENLTVFNPE